MTTRRRPRIVRHTSQRSSNRLSRIPYSTLLQEVVEGSPLVDLLAEGDTIFSLNNVDCRIDSINESIFKILNERLQFCRQLIKHVQVLLFVWLFLSPPATSRPEAKDDATRQMPILNPPSTVVEESPSRVSGSLSAATTGTIIVTQGRLGIVFAPRLGKTKRNCFLLFSRYDIEDEERTRMSSPQVMQELCFSINSIRLLADSDLVLPTHQGTDVLW